MPNKTTKISARLENKDLYKLNELCAIYNLNVSEIIRASLRMMYKEHYKLVARKRLENQIKK